MLLAQVRLEPEDRLEVVRAQFDRRLADLERRLGHRVRPLLGDEDLQRRLLLLELSRQREAGEAAAGNDDIVVVRHADLL